MRKSRLLVLTLALSMGLSLVACSKSNVDITTETTASVVETNAFGLENINFNTLKSSIDNKDTFYVYIDYKNGVLDEEKEQWVKDALTQITQENNITCNFYYISENDLSDDDISYIDDLSKDMVAKEIEFYQKWGNEYDFSNNPIEKLTELYIRINALCDEDENVLEECRETFKKLEDGDEYCVNLWKKIKDLSMEEFNKIYEMLDVHFDEIDGEAFYSDKLEEVVDILE